MTDTLTLLAREQFKSQLDVDWDSLLAPISEEEPTGKYLRGNGVYSSIQEARRYDHELSQGVWQYDLKRAEWDKVSEIATSALCNKSKDLQIGFWLLEAQIFQHGFAGIAPCIVLLRELCDKFWQALHPQFQNGDTEYRINPVVWANEKLLPVLRMVPLTRRSPSDTDYCWSDWEIAQRNEHVKENHGKLTSNDLLPEQFIQAVNSTPSDFYKNIYADIHNAITAIEGFSELLDQLCGSEAPSLGQLTRLLREISGTLEYLLSQRGVALARDATLFAPETGADGTNDADDQSSGVNSSSGGGGASNPPPGDRPEIKSRQQAYALLAAAADYLVSVEPHSPSPYLVKQAIEWGKLSTPELYQELFVRYQGQLNIFELLGLDLDATEKKTGS